MIGIICITATLVFDESESAGGVSMHNTSKAAKASCLRDIQSACSASWSGNVAAHKTSVAIAVLEFGPAEAMRRRQDGVEETRVGIMLEYRWF